VIILLFKIPRIFIYEVIYSDNTEKKNNSKKIFV